MCQLATIENPASHSVRWLTHNLRIYRASLTHACDAGFYKKSAKRVTEQAILIFYFEDLASMKARRTLRAHTLHVHLPLVRKGLMVILEVILEVFLSLRGCAHYLKNSWE